MLMLIFPPAEQQKFSSRNMTARTQWLDRFLLFCLHNKSFTPEIAENLSVGKQLWWLGKDDNFQDIMGCLIILHMGIGSSHWVQNTYPRWDFPEVPKEALKGYRVNRHNQSWVFIEWKRKMRKNKPRTTFLSVPITGHDRAQEHNTEQVWWREWGQNRRQGPVALVNSLNIPSETRTMSGISIFKHKVFSYLKMAWWIKFKHKEKNPGVHLLMPSVCLKQIFVVAY